MDPAAEATSRRRTAARVVIVGVLLAGVCAAATAMAFLCDDAFITFRHVSNAIDGHGLVWNAPPFHPVEGYTGFAWAVLLWLVWLVCGIEPPRSANAMSIALGMASFAIAAVAAFRLRDRDGRAVPIVVAAMALLVLASNRTFLQWMSGGLETALFNLAFAGWVLLAFRAPERRGGRWLAGWSAAAALAALTRPDGLLLVATTAAVAGGEALRRQRPWSRALLGLLPLGAVVLHVLWRRWFYGEWLPNTYYAKVTAPWPQAGWRYLWCFAYEHGLWWWGLLVAGWLAATVGRGAAARRTFAGRLPAFAAVAATVVHVGYYTLRVGGDHFEYRVLSHLIPLLVLSAAAMTASLTRGSLLPLAALLGLGLAGVPGWLHYALVRQVQPPAYVSLSSGLPAWARPLTREYDRHQAWLHLQFNCTRCSAHQDSLTGIYALLPARARHAADPEDLPVVRSVAVGLVGWMLPDIAVIDLLGLCDRVVARSQLTVWNTPYLPREVLLAAIASADSDGDGFLTSNELNTAFGKAPGFTPESTRAFIDLMLLLFAYERDDGLTVDEAGALEPFFAQLRWIAHERRAPPGYVAALDPNVTIEQRQLVVRKREVPLTAERVRAIEAEWWQRVATPGR